MKQRGELVGRRSLLGGLALLACQSRAGTPAPASPAPDTTQRRLAALEQKTGGKIGVAAWDLETNARVSHREHERFLFCSTFKLPLAALVLQRVDAGQEQLDRRIKYDPSALMENCPISSLHVDSGMTVAEMCEATVTVSDNAAGNLLLDSIGGPPALTAFFRALGDDVSRLDRKEPELNDYAPGDLRDTTTPAAMLHTLGAMLVSEQALSPSSRQLLGEWMSRASTGLRRLRSAFPHSWRAGDKTGTGYEATNDLAIAWRAQGKPLLVAAYTYGVPGTLDERSDLIGQVGRIVVDALGVSP
jgi:beta-lactamase class A